VGSLGGALVEVIIAESADQEDSGPDHFSPGGNGHTVVMHLRFRHCRNVFALETMRIFSGPAIQHGRLCEYHPKRNSRSSIPILNPLLRCPCEYCRHDKRTRSETSFLAINVSLCAVLFLDGSVALVQLTQIKLK
jgi:hypothetical protein